MKDKELRRLRRADLLEILVEQGERIEKLEKELSDSKAKLNSRDIMLEESGSIAEASLRLNEVFESAESAAKQYLDNIQRLSREQEEIFANRDAENREQAERIISDARQEAELIIERAKEEIRR